MVLLFTLAQKTEDDVFLFTLAQKTQDDGVFIHSRTKD